MRPRHIIAFTLACAVLVAAVTDSIVLVVTGHRTFLTDSDLATPVQAIGVSVLLCSSYLSQAAVVYAERDRFAAGNRVTRWTRWPLLIGLLALGVVGLIVPKLVDWGLLPMPVSDALAGAALLLTFGSAVVLGLATLRRNPLGIGARVLAAILPMVAVTVLLALAGSALASPIFATVVSALGVSLLGVGVKSPSQGGRPQQTVSLS